MCVCAGVGERAAPQVKAILKVRFRFVLGEFVPCEREPNPELHSRASIYDAIAGKYNSSAKFLQIKRKSKFRKK